MRKEIALCMIAALSSAAWAEEDLDFLLDFEESANEPQSNQQQEDKSQSVPSKAAVQATPVKSIELAEEAPPTAKPAPTGPQLEEIIVTAEKTSASLQDTPISIAAFNAEQLEVAGIEGMDDIAGSVPGLQIDNFPTNNATLRFYIRGIGIIDPQITQDAAVGIYLDGVYVARSTGTALDVADLERIEVLRGPQGTLYGRNTTGGAVNLITKRPSTEAPAISHSTTIGNFGFLKSKSSLNMPLGESLAAKVSLMFSEKDGFVENAGPGGDYGDREQLGGRFDLRWEGWEFATLDYSYDFSDSVQYNYSYQAITTPESDKGPTEQIKREAQANTVYSHRMLRTMATGAPLEAGGTLINGHALTLTGNWGRYDWKYIAAYRDLDDDTYTDLGGGAGSTSFRVDTHSYDGPTAILANDGEPLPLAINNLTQNQWSHEFQLGGAFLDDRLSFIGGLFWFEEEGDDDWTPLHHQFSAALSPAQLAEYLGPVFGAYGPRLVNIVNLRNTIENEAWAGFGQLSWTPDIWDQRLSLTLGYRHSEDKRAATKTRISANYVEFQQDGQGVAVPITSPLNPPANPITDAVFGNVSLLNVEQFDAVPASRKDDDDSISLVAEFALNEDSNIYGKYVEAYKSGGFNTRDPQVDGTTRPAADGEIYGFGFSQGFAPEYVTSLETGLKTELMDRRLRLNTSLFLTDYTDMQINFLVPGTVSDTKVTNAGKARMFGLETDATYLASRDLLLTASYSYLNAKITEVIDRISGDNVAEEFQFPSAPEHSLALSADWTIRRADWGDLALHSGFNFVDTRLGGSKAGAPVDLDPHKLLNLRLMGRNIHWADGELTLAIWGKNLLNDEYPTNAIDNLPQADRAVIWGEPASYGLDVIFRL